MLFKDNWFLYASISCVFSYKAFAILYTSVSFKRFSFSCIRLNTSAVFLVATGNKKCISGGLTLFKYCVSQLLIMESKLMSLCGVNQYPHGTLKPSQLGLSSISTINI